MKVVVHTPRVQEEEWDIPAAEPGVTDRELLAIIRGHRVGLVARRLGVRTVDTGGAFVYSRGETDLEVLGRQLADARTRQRDVMTEAMAAAVRLVDEGTVSERQAAATLGVDRATVRAWRTEAAPAEAGQQ